ncbi:MAG: hypothetical protein AAF399_14840, partial [Bacteroidota bacterium]
MELVEILAEILKYVVPAGLVLLAVKYMNDQQLKRQQVEETHRLRAEILKTHLPLKLSAYERGILFLERISPENLLPRVSPVQKNVRQFLAELKLDIHSEYEHNLAQQLYISPQGWQMLRHAKEDLINLIQQQAKELPPESEALQLSLKVLEAYMGRPDNPVRKA